MALNEDEKDRLETIFGVLSENRSKLNDRSRQFLDDQQKRYEEYGSEVRLSVKQWTWLENLMEQFQ